MKKKFPKFVLGFCVQLAAGLLAVILWLGAQDIIVTNLKKTQVPIYQAMGWIFPVIALAVYVIWYMVYSSNSKKKERYKKNAQGQWPCAIVSFLISGAVAALLTPVLCGKFSLLLSLLPGAIVCALIIAVADWFSMKLFAPWM